MRRGEGGAQAKAAGSWWSKSGGGTVGGGGGGEGVHDARVARLLDKMSASVVCRLVPVRHNEWVIAFTFRVGVAGWLGIPFPGSRWKLLESIMRLFRIDLGGGACSADAGIRACVVHI